MSLCKHPDHDDARFTAVACPGCQFDGDPTNVGEVVRYAELRYLYDAEFCAIVNMAVRTSVPETISPGINDALNEAATTAASLALVLFELELKKLSND